MSPEHPDVVERLRRICLALPHTSERLSHDEPAWFYRQSKAFVTHGRRYADGALGFWCKAPPGRQAELVAAEPESFFMPPYTARLGEIGVRLAEPIDWARVEDLVGDAWSCVSGAGAGTGRRASPD